jgi:hypothetical protein
MKDVDITMLFKPVPSVGQPPKGWRTSGFQSLPNNVFRILLENKSQNKKIIFELKPVETNKNAYAKTKSFAIQFQAKANTEPAAWKTEAIDYYVKLINANDTGGLRLKTCQSTMPYPIKTTQTQAPLKYEQSSISFPLIGAIIVFGLLLIVIFWGRRDKQNPSSPTENK